MFDDDLDGYDARRTLVAAGEVRDLQAQAEVAEMRLCLHFADLHPDPATVTGGATVPGGERGVVYGGVGCPVVAEFTAAEFGAVTGRSTGAAASYLGQCLALRHRLPLTFAQVLSGHAAAWKARMIAKACLELSQEAAAIVDQRVASIVDSVTPLRLANIVRAAMSQADPEAARAAAEARARQRGVWAGRTDDHGTTMLFVRAATGAVVRFKATIDQIADALAALGDTDSLDQRRAKAIDVIADPALADKLLQVANHLTTSPEVASQFAADATGDGPDVSRKTSPSAKSRARRDPTDDSANASAPASDDLGFEPVAANSATPSSPLDVEAPDSGRGMDQAARRELSRKLNAIQQLAYTGRRRRRTVLYAHITDEVLLAGQGVARVEGYGPVFANRLSELLGHDQVIVQPVIDLNTAVSVDAYEIPRRIREQVKLTYPVEQFPYGTATTTNSIDLDHIEAFDPNGPPGQTSTTNLAPLRRFSHRVKTHGGWSTSRIDDHTQEWTTRHGFRFRVDDTGTHRIDDC